MPARYYIPSFLPLVLLSAMVSIPAHASSLVAGPDSLSQAKGEVVQLVVPVVADWIVGDRWDIEVITGERDFSSDGSVTADSSITRYRKVVTEIGDDFYRVRWYPQEYESTSDYDYDELMSGIDERLMIRMAADGYELRLNELGGFVAMENERMYLDLVSTLIDEIVLAEAENDEMAAGMRQVFEHLGGAAWLLQKAIEPINFFYALNGYEWYVDETRYYEDVMAFGQGHEVEVIGSVRVHDLDEKEGRFTLTETIKADDRQLRRAIVAMFAAGGADADELNQELEAATIEMRDENVYQIDYVLGMMVGLDRIRVMTIDDTRNETFTRIRVNEP